MKKLLSVGLFAFGMMSAASVVLAGPVADATKASVMEAREHLVSLLSTTDKDGQAKRVADIKLATAKVDTLIEQNADTLKAFSEPWKAFKNTRDTELIPNILAGKIDEAKALATGVQAERLKKMMDALGAVSQ